MSRIIERTGNIFTTNAEAIGHGVNCKGVMGAGLAKTVRHDYPEVYHDYMAAYWRDELIPGCCIPSRTRSGKWIMNIASQDEPGATARMDLLLNGTSEAIVWLETQGIDRLALPQIGCGIGGLNWDNVKNSLEFLAQSSGMVLELWSWSK